MISSAWSKEQADAAKEAIDNVSTLTLLCTMCAAPVISIKNPKKNMTRLLDEAGLLCGNCSKTYTIAKKRVRKKEKKRELQKYFETHTVAECRELLGDAAIVLDPLGQELIRKSAE